MGDTDKKNDSFEGQYSRKQAIRLEDNVEYPKGTYFTPLGDLLAECTDVLPDNRPNIEQVLARYEEWEKMQHDFARKNRSQWVEIIKELFPYSVPTHAEWTDIKEIKNVLNMISHYEDLNYLFFPSSGGLNLKTVYDSYEEHCLEMDLCGLRQIFNPKILTFESIGEDLLWNYFRMECNPLETVLKSTCKDSYEEGVSEMSPLKYEDYKVMEDVDLAKENGYNVTSYSRQVTRQIKGSYVIFSKKSLYNRTTCTTDGRHDKMSAEEFRAYIEKMYNKYKGTNDNLSIHDL